MMIKVKLKSSLCFLFMCFLFVVSMVPASSMDLISKLGGEAIRTLTAPNAQQSEVEAQFLNLLNRDFAVRDIAQFVLGRYWKTANDSQRERFVNLFQHRLKKAYVNRFKEFAGVNFTVIKEREESGYHIVSSTIQKPGGPVTPVDWRVKNGKIEDVVVGGISMRSTLRADYNALVGKHGGQIDNFLNALEVRG